MNLFPLLSIISLLISLSIVISTDAIENQTRVEQQHIQQQQQHQPLDIPNFFVIQHAQNGSISKINMTFILKLNESNKTILSSDISKTFNLQLNNISDKTILLYNSNELKVKTIPTDKYIENWSMIEREDSFESNSQSNIAILILEDDRQNENQDKFIVELFNPYYNKDQKFLNYTIKLENDVITNKLPDKFNKTTLIIDRKSDNLIPTK